MHPRLALAVMTLVALLALPATSATAAAPANDAFAAPATLTSESPALLGDNLEATVEPSETESGNFARWDDCGSFTETPTCGSSVWYAFTAPATGDYTIDTCDKGTEVDTVLYAYSGSALGALAELASNDDASTCDGGYGSNGSRITFAATEGTTYRIQVLGYNAAEGTFYLRAYPAASPPPAAAIDTRITRFQSVVSNAPYNSRDGTHSGARRTASFAFVSTAAAAAFECSLDGAPFAPCSSPVSYDTLTVDGARREFRVRSSDGATDATPSVQRFTLDDAAPDTSILAGPAEGATVAGPVQFTRQSTQRSTEFLSRCTIDGIGPTDCTGPLYTLAGLCDRSHSFGIASMDEAGNLDATPALRTFTIAGNSVCADPALGAPAANAQPTLAGVEVPTTTGGVPVRATLRYGTTSAYGETIEYTANASDTSVYFGLRALQPGTTYHYDVKVTNGAGASASTADQTLTTAALPGGESVPAVSLGTPVVTGRHAARIPFTITAGSFGGGGATTRLYLDKGPASLASGTVFPDNELGSPVLPASTAIDVLDLEPGTTYHYRVLVEGAHTTLTDERTFTTPAVPVPAPAPVAGAPSPPPAGPAETPFRLKQGNVTVGKMKRSAKRVTVTVKRLPKGTKLTLKVKASKKTLASAKATASASGTARLSVKLGRKARAALRSRRLKRVTFTVTATPPGGKPTAVTISRRL